jgi:hypothetical protein
MMDSWAAEALVDWAAGRAEEDRETRRDLERELREYADRLAGASPSPAESLLAETVAMAWFALRMHEAHFFSASTPGGGLTFNQAKFHLTKIDRAHARLMSALKTLATVRRLAVPAVQINVARQQVNQQVVSPQTRD